MCSFKGNNLKNFLSNWEQIGTNFETLEWIQHGVKIPFKNIPTQFYFKNRNFKRHESYFIRCEIKKLLKAECIKKVDSRPKGVSPLSVVPKKNHTFRLIHDLRHLNAYCNNYSVLYEDIKTVLDIHSSFFIRTILQEQRASIVLKIKNN